MSPVESRQWLTLIGEGFTAGAVVTFMEGGQAYVIPPERLQYLDDTRLRVLAGLFPASDDWSVTVADSSGVVSAAFPLVFESESITATHSGSAFDSRLPALPWFGAENGWSGTEREKNIAEILTWLNDVFLNSAVGAQLGPRACPPVTVGGSTRKFPYAFTSTTSGLSVVTLCLRINVNAGTQSYIDALDWDGLVYYDSRAITTYLDLLDASLGFMQKTYRQIRVAYSSWEYDKDRIVMRKQGRILTTSVMPELLTIEFEAYFGVDFLLVNYFIE